MQWTVAIAVEHGTPCKGVTLAGSLGQVFDGNQRFLDWFRWKFVFAVHGRGKTVGSHKHGKSGRWRSKERGRRQKKATSLLLMI